MKSVGLQGKGQGQASQRLKIDNVYEQAKAEGRLDSPSILGGIPLPWTSDAVNKMNNKGADMSKVKAVPGMAQKKLSPEEMNKLKKSLAKPIITKKEEPVAAEASKKKGLFGLF